MDKKRLRVRTLSRHNSGYIYRTELVFTPIDSPESQLSMRAKTISQHSISVPKTGDYEKMREKRQFFIIVALFMKKMQLGANFKAS